MRGETGWEIEKVQVLMLPHVMMRTLSWNMDLCPYLLEK